MRQLKIEKQIMNRGFDSLDKYLSEIGKTPLLTPEEEVILTQKIKLGDEIAVEKMAKANLRFVVSVAKQYQNQGLSLPDLINEGNRGLIKAITMFDETRGFKLISYAVWWIRQFIIQAISEQSRIVKLPLNKIGTLNKINKCSSKLEQKFQRDPTPDEIAEYLEIQEHDVEETLSLRKWHLSLDKKVKEDDETTFIENLSSNPNNENLLIDESLKKEIDRALSSLPGCKDKDIIISLFGLNGKEPLSIQKVAEKLNLKESTISYRLKRSVDKLKKNRLLKEYL